MKLNTRTRYAVMALTDLAQQDQAQRVRLKDMAARQELSVPYLEQLFATLRRKGLVRSTRGLNGGYALARPATAISLAHILEALDEPITLTRCKANGVPGTGCLKDGRLCANHHVWATLETHIRSYTEHTTLAMMTEPQAQKSCSASRASLALETQTAAKHFLGGML